MSDYLMEREDLLTLIKGKSNAEVKEILLDKYGLSWDYYDGTCKSWYAKVFTYCNTEHFEEELNFFLWLVNFFAHLFHVCFQEEDTIFLGCICPCGQKQTILYYSITRA